MVLWALVSVGLWFITPDRFTKTDGLAGVFTMVVVGVVGLFIALPFSTILKRLFGND
jgi:hypothetical protein